MNHNITPLYRLMAAMEEDKGGDEEQERWQTGPPQQDEKARGSQVSESAFQCMDHNITPLGRLKAAKEGDEGGGEKQEWR